MTKKETLEQNILTAIVKDFIYSGHSVCPVCGNCMDDRTHEPGCPLAEYLTTVDLSDNRYN